MSKLIKIVCQQCGTVNTIVPGSISDDEQWLECAAPEGFEWALPAGKIEPVVGAPIYISATGAKFSREAYIQKFNLDPEIALKKMRGGGRTPIHIGGR